MYQSRWRRRSRGGVARRLQPVARRTPGPCPASGSARPPRSPRGTARTARAARPARRGRRRCAVRRRAHVLGGLQVELPGEHRQPRPQQPLLGRAQLVAPADRRTQRLMPGQRVAPAARQQPEAVLQAGQHLRGGEGAAAAPPPVRGRAGSRRGAGTAPVRRTGCRRPGRSPGTRPPPGPRTAPPPPARPAAPAGTAARPPRPAAGAPRRVPAAPAHTPQQLAHQRGALVHQMLEPVEDQQESALGEMVEKDLTRRPSTCDPSDRGPRRPRTRRGPARAPRTGPRAKPRRVRPVRAAARAANRDLPTPPMPVTVTRRAASRASASCASSAARPTNALSSRGRLPSGERPDGR